MGGHLLNLILYATVTAVLFSIFMRDDTRARVRFAAMMSGSMIAAAIAAAWLMHLAE